MPDILGLKTCERPRIKKEKKEGQYVGPSPATYFRIYRDNFLYTLRCFWLFYNDVYGLAHVYRPTSESSSRIRSYYINNSKRKSCLALNSRYIRECECGSIVSSLYKVGTYLRKRERKKRIEVIHASVIPRMLYQ